MINKEDLKKRTKQFALRIIRLTQSLPRTQLGKVLSNQLLRAGTSVGANYRSACRARSTADFIAKMGIVVEEADESLYWMELIVDSGLVDHRKMQDIMNEANELVAIFTASIITSEQKISHPKSSAMGGCASGAEIINHKS